MGGRLLVLRLRLGEKLSELTVSTGNTVSKWAFGDNPSLLASESLADSVIKDLEPLMGQLQEEAKGQPETGYERRFTFDQRMALGYSLPIFPGTDPSIVQSVFVYDYGQREQAEWN